MRWLGLDIGGANIKAASTDGEVFSTSFQFWTERDRLEEVLTQAVKRFHCDSPLSIAATMTAELADCFETRQAGVEYVVDCLAKVCQSLELAAPIFASTDLVFRDAGRAKAQWLKTAASNWANLASFASRFLPQQSGIVFDLGSTTTDIIPVRSGEVLAQGKTDFQRLQNGELVYVGARRTPVCSLVDALTIDGVRTPIAREHFATIDDAMLLRGFVDEDENDLDTADGRPRTAAHAAQRISRMVCEDARDLGIENAILCSTEILGQVEAMLLTAIEAVENTSGNPQSFVCTGSGVSFAKYLFNKHYPNAKLISLGLEIGHSIDIVAPAFAVAVLASEGKS